MEAFVPCHLAIRQALIMAAWGTSWFKAGESLKSGWFGWTGGDSGGGAMIMHGNESERAESHLLLLRHTGDPCIQILIGVLLALLPETPSTLTPHLPPQPPPRPLLETLDTLRSHWTQTSCVPKPCGLRKQSTFPAFPTSPQKKTSW